MILAKYPRNRKMYVYFRGRLYRVECRYADQWTVGVEGVLADQNDPEYFGSKFNITRLPFKFIFCLFNVFTLHKYFWQIERWPDSNGRPD